MLSLLTVAVCVQLHQNETRINLNMNFRENSILKFCLISERQLFILHLGILLYFSLALRLSISPSRCIRKILCDLICLRFMLCFKHIFVWFDLLNKIITSWILWLFIDFTNLLLKYRPTNENQHNIKKTTDFLSQFQSIKFQVISHFIPTELFLLENLDFNCNNCFGQNPLHNSTRHHQAVKKDVSPFNN